MTIKSLSRSKGNFVQVLQYTSKSSLSTLCNSWFLQARIIHELSKKVFHALKTDPKNFELEFSETRRRTSRRPQNEAKGPMNSSSPKPATNFRTNCMTVNVSSKPVSYSLGGTTILRKSIQGNPDCSSAATSLSARDNEMLSGKNLILVNFLSSNSLVLFEGQSHTLQDDLFLSFFFPFFFGEFICTDSSPYLKQLP